MQDQQVTPTAGHPDPGGAHGAPVPGATVATLDPAQMLVTLQEAQERERHHKEVHNWQWTMATPVITAASVWTYGQCAYLTNLLLNQPLTIVMGAAAGAVLATFVIRVGFRKFYSRTWSSRWNKRFYLSGAVATLFSAVTSLTGPTWFLTGVLTLASVSIAAKLWKANRLHQVELPTEEPPALVVAEPEPDEEIEPELDEVELTQGQIFSVRWDRSFAAKGKKYENSTLHNEVRLVNGWQYDLDLDPDRNTFADLNTDAARAKIAGVMGLLPENVLTHLRDGGDYSKAVLTLIIDNPLLAGVDYEGPHYDNGWVNVGLRSDGEGYGRVQLADHIDRTFSGLLCGGPNGGKSVGMRHILMSAKYSRCYKVLYVDGSEAGGSSGVLNKYMDWSQRGVEGALRQLDAVEEYMMGRELETAQLPDDVNGVNPTPGRQGVIWGIDELHRILRNCPEFAARLEAVLRLAPKNGLGVWASTQGLELSGDFGGNANLRDLLTQDNVVAFRSGSPYSHSLITGLGGMAPHTLPRGGGFAFIARNDRADQIRTGYTNNFTPWAEALPSTPWDEVTQLAIVPYIKAYQQDVTQERAASQTALKTWKMRRQLAPHAKRTKTGSTEAAGPFDDLLEHLPPVLTKSAVVNLDPGKVGVESTDGTFVLREQHRDVLAALLIHNHRATGDIVKQCSPPWSRRTVNYALAALGNEGIVASEERGNWTPTDLAQAAFAAANRSASA